MATRFSPDLVCPPELQETPLVIHEPGGFCLMGFGLASLLLVHRQKFARFPNQK